MSPPFSNIEYFCLDVVLILILFLFFFYFTVDNAFSYHQYICNTVFLFIYHYLSDVYILLTDYFYQTPPIFWDLDCWFTSICFSLAFILYRLLIQILFFIIISNLMGSQISTESWWSKKRFRHFEKTISSVSETFSWKG